MLVVCATATEGCIGKLSAAPPAGETVCAAQYFTELCVPTACMSRVHELTHVHTSFNIRLETCRRTSLDPII